MYGLVFSFDNQIESVGFHVQKFRKPKFLISASFDHKKAVYGDQISAEVFAEFAFGGALTNKKAELMEKQNRLLDKLLNQKDKK